MALVRFGWKQAKRGDVSKAQPLQKKPMTDLFLLQGNQLCKTLANTSVAQFFPLSFYNKKAMGELNTPRLAIIMDDTSM
jgi:hypothetical protein